MPSPNASRSNIQSASRSSSQQKVSYSEQQRRGGQTRQNKGQTPKQREDAADRVIRSSSKPKSLIQKHTAFANVVTSSASRTAELLRAPQVYRQAFDVDNLISATSTKLQQDPNHEKALYMRASSYLKRGQPEEAIDDCNRLI